MRLTSRWVLDCHVLQAKDIVVRQELQELDLSQGGDGELYQSAMGAMSSDSQRLRTPSFSLCMMIFFRA